MLAHIKHCIFSENRLWQLMYWDELVEAGSFQLTYLQHADRPWYNCAHGVAALNHQNLRAIEHFFFQRRLPSRLYTLESGLGDFPHLLQECGYYPLPEEEERWYRYSFATSRPVQDWRDYYHGAAGCVRVKEIAPKSADLVNFARLNQQQSALPVPVSQSWIAKVRTRIPCRQSISLRFFGVYFNEELVATMSLGSVGSLGFLSEAAVKHDHLRQGLFSLLIAYLLRYCRALGFSAVHARCDIAAYTNATCIKLGFAPFFTRTLWEKQGDTPYER